MITVKQPVPVAVMPGMTRCEWCACVYDAAGNIVDPRPTDWGAIPHKVCNLCSIVERMRARQNEAAKRLPPAIPKVKGVGTRPHQAAKVIQRRVEAVSAGRSCLPESDRD